MNNINTYKVIIFDWGGVLEGPDDLSKYENHLQTLANDYSFKTGADLLKHIYHCKEWEDAKRGRISGKDFWNNRLELLGIKTKERKCEFKNQLFKHRNSIRPDMYTLIRELRERYSLAMISNTERRQFAQYIAETQGLKDFFDVVIGSADVGIAKPERAIYELALIHLGIDAYEAIFIDDDPRNVQSAEKLGIPSILFISPDSLRTTFRKRSIL